MIKIDKPIQKVCEECGKKYIPLTAFGRPLGENSVNWKRRRFCSKHCSGKFSNRERPINWKSIEAMRKANLGGRGGMFGKNHTKEAKNKIRGASINHWEIDSYRKKVLVRRPMSGLEIRVEKVIKKYNLPYKFVGNGQFSIERKVPDFINVNGEKKAVEVYWKKHKDQFRRGGEKGWKEEREKIFSKYGWELLFIEGTRLNEIKILKALGGGGQWTY